MHSVTHSVTGSGDTYTLLITAITGNGTIIPTIEAGVTADAAGNTNAASTGTDNTIVYDSAKPACKACHNEKKNPLDAFGAAGTAEDAKGWIRTPKEMFVKAGKKGMMPAYSEKKVSDEDLEALTAYLLSLT